jgi:hypothetical protein
MLGAFLLDVLPRFLSGLVKPVAIFGAGYAASSFELIGKLWGLI